MSYVSFAATTHNGGYWILDDSGTVYPLGDAPNYGRSPTGAGGAFVSMAATPEGGGYWLLDSAGQVYAYGSIEYFGNMPGSASGRGVSLAPTANGEGYWILDSVGQIYTFGNAQYYGGSPGGYTGSFVAMVRTSDGAGYWLMDDSGQIYAFGDAPYHGNAPSALPANAVVLSGGIMGIDAAATGYPATFYTCCKSEGRPVIFVDIASSGYENEVTTALDAGCYVVLYQGYDPALWANPANGTSRGQSAATAAQTVGYPKQATIYLDIEDASDISAQTMTQWVNNWAQEVTGGGWEAGVYLGCGQPLSGSQWNSIPKVNHFWETCSTSCRVAVPPGYQVVQTACSATFCGQSVDLDTFQTDNNGGTTVGMRP